MALVGIDVGGTKISGALVEPDGSITNRTLRYLESRGGRQVSLLILDVIDDLVKQSYQSGKSIDAIGVCVPGVANSKTDTVWVPNIPGWEQYPLKKEIESMESIANIPVNIASDRTCYILGEVWKGAAQGCENAIFIAVGTGVGAGILLDGHIVHGQSDIAGAIGWMALQPPYIDEYNECGCFETYASGNGIARLAKKMLAENRNERSLLGGKYSGEVTSHDVFAAYDKGDLLAGLILAKAVQFWGMASANLVSLFNPEKIIWGGGVFGPACQLLHRIYAEACKWAQPVSMRQVHFEPSMLSGDAGLLGAAYLAILSLNDSKTICYYES